MNKPYVIISPPFDPVSGGVRVMYGLYGWLLAKGQIAFINEKPREGDFIGIYPEIQRGNPAGASTVVRYILNKPGVVPALMSDGSMQYGDTEFDENDKLYYFSRLFGGDKNSNYMFLPILNLHIFKDQGKKRTKTAYFVGKGMNYPYKPVHPEDSVLIDRQLALNQQDLADILNECHTMYCYDPVSAMLEIARLCGVKVIMINPVYTRKEFEKYETGMNGINWGKDEGNDIYTHKFRMDYIDMVEAFSKRLDKFIDETQ